MRFFAGARPSSPSVMVWRESTACSNVSDFSQGFTAKITFYCMEYVESAAEDRPEDMLQSFESRYLFLAAPGFVNRSCSHFSHCKLFTRLQSGLMFPRYYIFSLLPPQHAIAIRLEQRGRRATRQQVNAPARTE